MRRALAASVAAHLAVALAAVLALRPVAHDGNGDGDAQGATAEMIFVNPGDGRTGATPSPPTPAPAAPTPGPAPAAPAPAAPAPPVAASQPTPAEAAASEPEPSAAAPTSSKTVPPAAAAPEVRLGDSGAEGTTSEVEGEDIPVGPDPAAPNIPPRYPPDAVRHGEQGTVVLEVAVAPDGGATGVGVYVSSGFAVLDRAARVAVARWRFRPKMDAGQPISARTLIRVRFRLD